ncbi:dihydroxyacetone kinase subunit L (plasmid) [Cryobacterium sp. LW097]|uniref:dihydroxyacetone kinase subunit DhaL n=1 Tax=unclassified Cryobacterium TaxID=2649013 RepID=UPI000B4CC4EB|nr:MULTISPECIES: dihydroxyacetone kinase subunit DhaL [unclassified Cryobacterium]ASD24215.1 dihydroxyacetone kinase subunit L [Cryobacterium sp. LW097]TFC57888.1 dihydroxyacetone kinase subunit L [Cryobacterium sp. TMB3-1-2]TFC63277.1 dihydroxyacetone kinase subunit L [Cryobacterium sp. TMB1-7]TFC75385.1 dihydroxyacetone kinase subunit L [Cryobacterium sp. TMB3-15]TFC77883.1 dihydroxyacetone kinase subunit L [Cryobacterium sp. TMB3-10]
MTNDTIDLDQLTGWLTRFRDLVTEKVAYLTELDSAIGDADHGSNMTRGMGAVLERIQASPAGTVDELFKGVGMTLVTSVGGASGPLYGTFFLRIGTTAGPVKALDASGLAAALRAGLDGVVARGKAEAGDKTMFDVLAPALDAFDAALIVSSDISSAARAAYSAARTGRDATEPLLARKGRASYLGERSIGHVDPGAASTSLLFQALAEILDEE